MAEGVRIGTQVSDFRTGAFIIRGFLQIVTQPLYLVTER